MVVLKQLGAGPELLHCHATLTLDAFTISAVTIVAVGGAEVTNKYSNCMISYIYNINIPLGGRLTITGRLLELLTPTLA